jgi:DNA-binding helix-hairpin-helix protein with protein kinase domain
VACASVDEFSGKTRGALTESGVMAQERSRTQRIRFQAGETAATVRDSVLLGTQDVYLLGATKGQLMTVKIASLEDNAVFTVTTPANQKGNGRPLKQEAVAWSGQLPETGDYQVIVGTRRGNASYRLQVSLK